MAERLDTDMNWVGRLVRVLVVFRTLVLLITIILLPVGQYKPIVGLAVLLAAALSYLPLRHWDRIARSVSRHPAYVAAEMLLASLILAAAGPRSPFFYFTLGTAAIAGVVYGRRGAFPFSALLIATYELVALQGFGSTRPLHDAQSIIFVPLLYPAALAAGVAARELIQRGVVTEVLLRDRTEALAAERERLRVARELHDSLAKTVEGLAMSAMVLRRRCERNPAGAGELADQLAGDARQAALEARALMSDLRPSDAEESLSDAVRRRAETFAERSGKRVEFADGLAQLAAGGPALDGAATHELLSILGESLINADRHGGAATIAVTLGPEADAIVLTVADDGAGLPEPVELTRLKAAGHFGLAGMYERARALGGRLDVASGMTGGTVVKLWVPAGGHSTPATDGERDAEPERRGIAVAGVFRRRRAGGASSAKVKA